jgi:hypothetical protein
MQRIPNFLWMQWAGNSKPRILWGPKSDILVVNVPIQVAVCYIGEPCDIQDTRTVFQ